MKPLKTSPWFVRLFLCLAIAAGAASLRAAPEPADPLVGNWFYFKNRPVTFKADGTAHWKGYGHGTWEYLRNPEVQRHYRIIWEHGKSIDVLVLAEDGNRGHVTNQNLSRNHYDVRRAVSDKPAANP